MTSEPTPEQPAKPAAPPQAPSGPDMTDSGFWTGTYPCMVDALAAASDTKAEDTAALLAHIVSDAVKAGEEIQESGVLSTFVDTFILHDE